MAVKLDMSKAYDRVEWTFLKEVLLRMGFAEEWVSLILRCVSIVSYTVNINGRRGDVFKPTRGLRQATKNKAKILKDILKEYEKCSGKCVNFSKSTIFFSSNTVEGDKATISIEMGIRRSTNMEKYLGLPNVVGKQKKESFQNLKDRIKQGVENWSTRFLSQGGKEVFIKSVLQAIPAYAMACFLLPKSLFGEFENLFARFWWQKCQRKKGIH
ncbi:uncharacterized protein [Gossypium hirsutum]|uniref:Reverse transcriptase n=1 Tax=Gossypium hirsutum TaxID=3635 RepID=A0A1U8KWZ5_GOSHI|nr:uncharacterized protein LOC107921591 [Gossypium hirsutum]